MNNRLEQKVELLISPIQTFVQQETVSSGFLFLATVIALILANSQVSEHYFEILNLPISVGVGNTVQDFDVRHIVNNGLMTFFFLMLGLEIKRELLVGELQEIKLAITVLAAALGGMCVPALIYGLFNMHTSTLGGWGIPMATDTAFALGLLLLLGQHVPQGLKAFLVAFAIIDDIGAITVITLFYTQELDAAPLGAAALCMLLLLACNVLGLRHISIYLTLGFMLWVALMVAGVHGTMAGVLVAAAVPARPRRGRQWFVRHARQLANQLDSMRMARREEDVLSDVEQHRTVEAAGKVSQSASTPLRRWERSLKKPVLLVILPLFALANAGIPITRTFLEEVVHSPIAWGIVVGLVAGKTLGISLFSWLVIRSGVGQLPAGVSMRHVVGVAILGGMGFTMSIYMAALSFATAEEVDSAKIAILCASALAGIVGYLWLRFMPVDITANTPQVSY